MKKFKVGIDSYSLKPLGLSPFEALDWALMNDADGIQFSEAPEQAEDRMFLDELSRYAAQNNLYLEWGGGEHVPLDLATGKAKDISAVNKKAAAQASRLGIRTVRSCSGGLMRWKEDSIPTETLLREMAKSLRAQKPMLKDLGLVLAIETHFEFTTFELLKLFDMCEAQPGEYLGICLDTMNLLTMLEDPAAATRRVLPWIVTTHIKDGAILLRADGLVSFVAEAGKGIVDFKKIFEELSSLGRDIHLSIEDHGGDFLIPIFDPIFITKFPDLTVRELTSLLKLASRTHELVNRKELSILDRSRWPELCEARVKRDIRHIRKVLETDGQLRL
jgi:sugar phosphate isomerase/epimerase